MEIATSGVVVVECAIYSMLVAGLKVCTIMFEKGTNRTVMFGELE